MSSGTSALSPFNTEQRRPTLARFQKKRDSENIVLILTSTCRLPLSPSLRFDPSHPLESASFRPQSGCLSILHSVCHSIRFSEVGMLRSALLVGWFTVNKISGTRHQPLTQYFFSSLSTATYWNYMYNVLPSIGHSFHSSSGIRDVVAREGEHSI